MNKGAGRAVGDWQDAVYLSIDAHDQRELYALDRCSAHRRPGPEHSYTVPLTAIPLPVLPAGNEYLVVQVDRRGQVAEPAAVKGDETAASASPSR